jgi:hypothetical protein
MKTNGYSFLENLTKAKEAPQTRSFDKITVTESLPRVDKAIKAAGNAMWDAWLIGLQQSGYDVDLSIPEPDRETWEPEM